MTEGGRFDEIIHPSTRLSIVALLAAADWVAFAFVRDELGLSDSSLSKQLATLTEAGYVAVDRPATGRPRRMRVRLTPEGRAAFQGHAAALQTIVSAVSANGITGIHAPVSGDPGSGRALRLTALLH